MTIEQRTARQHITVTGDNEFVMADTGLPFDDRAYSRLKYGSLQVVRELGQALGQHLVEELPETVLDENPPEAVVTYKAVPPACFALSRFCMDVINTERTAAGLEPGSVIKISKGAVLSGDYAASSPSDREQALQAIAFSTDGHDYSGKPVLFLDDVRITGTTERRVRDVLLPEGPQSLTYGYAVAFDEAAAQADAAVESRINHGYVKSLREISDIAEKDGFVLNIRALKRILSDQEALNRDTFLQGLPDHLLQEMYAGAQSTGPAFVASYLQGVKDLERHIHERGLKLPDYTYDEYLQSTVSNRNLISQ